MKRLAAALELARRSRSRNGKEAALATAMAAIARDSDDLALATAARLASGRMLAVGDGRALGVGGSLLVDVACAATRYDAETVVACARKTGELAEAFALLVQRTEAAGDRPGLSFQEIAHLTDALAAEPGRAGKRALLEAALARATPLEIKYLCKTLGGEMRIGAQDGVVEGAIARAFGLEVARVRLAAVVVTDVGELAVLARDGALDDARLVVGRPVAFMLATPMESIATPLDAGAYVFEDKIDGVRAQVHRSADGAVSIFARGLDRTTHAFPEIVDALRDAPQALVLDGEIVAVDAEGHPRPFQALQPRLQRKPRQGSPERPDDRDATRVALVAFDLLADASGPLLALPWTERRTRLEALASALGGDTLRVNPTSPLPIDRPLEAAIDEAFRAARGRGHEGLVLKRSDASYDAGRRGQAWIKVKRAHATLDCVVVAAEEGHGRRAGILSDYTFAVWGGPESNDELLVIGKAYSGLRDEEIDTLTRRLEGLVLERRGGVWVVRPDVVLEVAFDGVQRSARHTSGFALRFPRIVRVRDDKRPDEADRLATVEALFEAQVATGHREEAAPAPARSKAKTQVAAAKKKGPRVAQNQLSLFGGGDDDS